MCIIITLYYKVALVTFSYLWSKTAKHFWPQFTGFMQSKMAPFYSKNIKMSKNFKFLWGLLWEFPAIDKVKGMFLPWPFAWKQSCHHGASCFLRGSSQFSNVKITSWSLHSLNTSWARSGNSIRYWGSRLKNLLMKKENMASTGGPAK